MGKRLENTLQTRVPERPIDRWTGVPPPHQGKPYRKPQVVAPITARVVKSAELAEIWSSFWKLRWECERVTVSERCLHFLYS